jgi:hypothetical protein
LPKHDASVTHLIANVKRRKPKFKWEYPWSVRERTISSLSIGKDRSPIPRFCRKWP